MDSDQGHEVPVDRQEDDLSRQRRKRAARLVNQPPSPFEDSRVRAVLADALAAIEQRGGDFDVEWYLVDHGHSPETVQTVLAHLGLVNLTHPSGGPSPFRSRW